jgi:hypothetical protein
LLHENLAQPIDHLPKPKGRPKKSANSNSSSNTPAPTIALAPGDRVEQQRAATPAPRKQHVPEQQKKRGTVENLTDEEQELQQVLRNAGCGHLFPALKARSITVTVLRRFSFSDFTTCLNIEVAAAYAIMQALCGQAAPKRHRSEVSSGNRESKNQQTDGTTPAPPEAQEDRQASPTQGEGLDDAMMEAADLFGDFDDEPPAPRLEQPPSDILQDLHSVAEACVMHTSASSSQTAPPLQNSVEALVVNASRIKSH